VRIDRRPEYCIRIGVEAALSYSEFLEGGRVKKYRRKDGSGLCNKTLRKTLLKAIKVSKAESTPS
jgi:hypothetical protein